MSIQVLVRSDKAFSGYEGVVESQHKVGKWEVYFIHDSGYGRKRRRVGLLFESAQEVSHSRLYSTLTIGMQAYSSLDIVHVRLQ